MMSFRILVAASVLWAAAALAQDTAALKQSFNAPKADVEQALKDLNAYQSGKLPFVEGFVGAINEPLGSFQRAYYQYTIDVQQSNDDQVTVSVNAKISAWHEDRDASKSGYRDLPSSGRLEQDLLERLRARLRTNAAEVAASRTPIVSPKLLGIPEAPPQSAAPAVEAPAAPSTAAAPTPKFGSFAPKASPLMPPSATAPDQDAHYQRLVQEEKSLNEVIAAQQRPDNLVYVKAAHTPVQASPAEGSKVLMYADAEDEFQFLKAENGWVHVQISGLNRGWIRGSQIQLPDKEKASQAAVASTPENFHQTKEETSTFPGDWAPLRGKNVKIIWVQPTGKSTQKSRLTYAEALFRKQAPELKAGGGIDGVVVVFDAAEGGMAATTLPALEKWGSGSLSDAAFLKECWFDPADAFTGSGGR